MSAFFSVMFLASLDSSVARMMALAVRGGPSRRSMSQGEPGSGRLIRRTAVDVRTVPGGSDARRVRGNVSIPSARVTKSP